MDLVDELRGEVEAAPAAGRLAELAVDLARTPQALGRHGTNLAIPMPITDADVHGHVLYTNENDCQLHASQPRPTRAVAAFQAGFAAAIRTGNSRIRIKVRAPAASSSPASMWPEPA